MARTYRRKKDNSFYLNYTREEFEEAKRNYLTYGCVRPATPLKIPRRGWFLEEWMDEYKVWQEELRAYRAQFRTAEYVRYQENKRFIRYVNGKLDYDEYVASVKAKHHSDAHCGSYWSKNSPHWFNNAFFERPMRRKHKQEINRAWKYDAWDELLLEPYIRDNGWTYW